MADGGPSAPPQPPAPAVSAPPVLPPNQPAEPGQAAPQAHIGQQPVLNWLHFRPEFTGKPEEDVEAHLLCTNDWINTLNSAYNEKKYAEILFHYRWLFVKADV